MLYYIQSILEHPRKAQAQIKNVEYMLPFEHFKKLLFGHLFTQTIQNYCAKSKSQVHW